MAHPGHYKDYQAAIAELVPLGLDGLEVYHPSHGPEIINTYQEYVRKHNLLLSTGSDSHSIPCRMPIKYPAEISRELLERVGIHVRA